MRFGDTISRVEKIMPDMPLRGIAVTEITSGLVLWVGSWPLHSGDTKYCEIHHNQDGSLTVKAWDGLVVTVVEGEK